MKPTQLNNMANNTYDFTEHLHRYAVWTAARAAQRGFTTTKNINEAIEATSLKELIHKPEIATGDFEGIIENVQKH